MVCPACFERGRFARHGTYAKYYYAEQIRILRLRCRGCRRTHALLPSFSLPGTSIGTEEAEAYLDARDRGVGRGRAQRQLEALGVGGEYGKRLERMFAVALRRAKALWAEEPANELNGLAWIAALTGSVDRPLWSLNRLSLERGCNCLCFCRASILRFTFTSASTRGSHNRGSPGR